MYADRARFTFLLLVLTQALHSVEEYVGRLWEVFQPAQFLSGLMSDDLETGFLIINISLFVFGMLCWLQLNRLTSMFIWFWIVIETINGIGHPIWAISEGTYVPGLATAPILLILAIKLFRDQSERDIKPFI